MPIRDSLAAVVRRFADVLGPPSFAGTPYPSGAVDRPEQLSQELGGTGTNLWGGFLRGEDFNPQMDAQTAIKNFDEMRRGDSQVHAALEVVKLPIRTAKYQIDPAIPDDPNAQFVADFVEWNLFERMGTTWDDVIRQALLMLDFGFMVFEKVWTVEDTGEYAGQIVLSKLAPRPPKTIWQWFTDTDGSLISIKQLTVKAGTYQFLDVPASKLVRFTFQQEGDNFTGISMLRSAYPHWLIKKQLYLIDAIRATRYGVGIPRAKLQEGYKPTADDKTAIAQMLQGMSSHQHAYIIQPPQMEIDILVPQVRQGGAEIMPSIEHQNEQITRNILAQFLDMGGRSQGGSRALGASAMGFFLNAIESIAGQVCDVLNKQVVKDLVDMNFDVGGKYPKIRPMGIRETDIQVMATAAAALAGAGLLTPDLDTENTFRDLMNLPENKGYPTGMPGMVPPVPGGVPAAPVGVPATPATATPATASPAQGEPAAASTTQYGSIPSNTTVPDIIPAVATVNTPTPAVIGNPVPTARSSTSSSGATDEEGHPLSVVDLPPVFQLKDRRPWTMPDGQTTFWRPPTAMEDRVLDLRELPKRLNTARTGLESTLKGVREEQILRFAPAVAHAGPKESVKPQLVGKMASDIAKAMRDVYDYGYESVHQELRKQQRSHHFAFGGAGSGNFGHAGRPGEIGGSSAGDARTSEKTGKAVSTPRSALHKVLHGQDAVVIHSELDDFLKLARDGDHHPDLTKVEVDGLPIFAGGLGIRRKDMPQISEDHQKAYIDYLRDEHGIQVQNETVDPISLLPVQNEIDAHKVGGMLKKFDKGKELRPIFVSRDHYVLDGHHRWATVASKRVVEQDPSIKLPVLRVMADHAKALATMHAYNKLHHIKSEAFAARDWWSLDIEQGYSLYEVAFYSPDEPRDDHGRWTDGMNEHTEEMLPVMEAGGAHQTPEHQTGRIIDELINRKKLAMEHKQLAFFDLKAGKSIRTPYGDEYDRVRGKQEKAKAAPSTPAKAVPPKPKKDYTNNYGQGYYTGESPGGGQPESRGWREPADAGSTVRALSRADRQGADGRGEGEGPSRARGDDGQAVAFASTKKKLPLLKASAQVSAQSATDKLLASARAEALRLKRAGWEDDEVEDALKIHMGELSDGDITRLANMEVNEAFSLGRTAAASELKDQIKSAIYSAILDNNVCRVCEKLDGEEFDVDSDEYEENMPPNANCAGGDQCRCTYIYELDPDSDGKGLRDAVAFGGAGSGNFGHEGRPGEVGGSGPGGDAAGGGDASGEKAEQRLVDMPFDKPDSKDYSVSASGSTSDDEDEDDPEISKSDIWDNMTSIGENEARGRFVEQAMDNDDVGSESYEHASEEMRDELKHDKDEQEKIADQAAKDIVDELTDDPRFVDPTPLLAKAGMPEAHLTLDPETFVYDPDNKVASASDHNWPIPSLDLEALRTVSGQTLSEEQKNAVDELWATKIDEAYDAKMTDLEESDDFMERRSNFEDEALQSRWDNLSSEDRLGYASDRERERATERAYENADRPARRERNSNDIDDVLSSASDTLGVNAEELVRGMGRMARGFSPDGSTQVEWDGRTLSVKMNAESIGSTEIVRTFTRQPDGSLRVHHDWFALPREAQGKGIAAKMLEDSMKVYDKFNVSYIDTLANIDVGGYAWGKLGFKAQDPVYFMNLVQGRAGSNAFYTEFARATGMDRNHPDFATKAAEGFKDIMTKGRAAGQNAPNVVANLPGGKGLMLNGSWNGFVDLKGNYESVFRKIVHSEVEKKKGKKANG